VDAPAAAYYRSLPGALGDRLRAVMEDSEDGAVMVLEQSRCPMWRDDGLCRIQAELGHDALCQTCRDFPRLRHDYGDFVELGLELSCPEAARLILSNVKFSTCRKQEDGNGEAEYNRSAMELLRFSRQAVLSFLEDSRVPVNQALAAILLYAHDAQEALDLERPLTVRPEDCLAKIKNMQFADGNAHALIAFFQELEILTENWQKRLAQPASEIQWGSVLRAMMGYMVLRYWLQAVSDLDLICRVKLAVSACLLVGLLGGDPVETAQLFSKEIENDPDNIEAILNGAYTSPALTDANLLALLH
jgi:lysine-N-methylase